MDQHDFALGKFYTTQTCDFELTFTRQRGLDFWQLPVLWGSLHTYTHYGTHQCPPAHRDKNSMKGVCVWGGGVDLARECMPFAPLPYTASNIASKKHWCLEEFVECGNKA